MVAIVSPCQRGDMSVVIKWITILSIIVILCWNIMKYVVFICCCGLMQLEACIHPFFDELRNPDTRLPTGRPLPPLFNFKPQGKY